MLNLSLWVGGRSVLEVKERANVFSVIYASSYTGAAIPTLIAGRMSESYSLLQVAYGYGALALIGTVVVIASRFRWHTIKQID